MEYRYSTRASPSAMLSDKLLSDSLYRMLGTKNSAAKCKQLILDKEGLGYINVHYNGHNVLHKAVDRDCDMELVQLLLEGNSKLVHSTAKRNTSCLHFAIKNRNTAMFTLLIKHGAPVDVISQQYGSPVQMIFCLMDHRTQFALLRALPVAALQHPVAFKQHSSIIHTSILSFVVMNYALRRNIDMVRELLLCGADAFVRDELGKSAISRVKMHINLNWKATAHNVANQTNLRALLSLFESAVCITLCSASQVKRLGSRSSLRHLPVELIRLLKDMLC